MQGDLDRLWRGNDTAELEGPIGGDVPRWREEVVGDTVGHSFLPVSDEFTEQ